MKTKYNNKKKGQMAEFGRLAVGIAVLAVLLTVTLLILEQGREESLDLAPTTTAYNQTLAITIDQFTALNGNCTAERTATITEVYNGTSGNAESGLVLLNAGNYTVVGSSLNVSNDALGGGVGAVATSVNVSYSCTETSYAYNSTVELTNSTLEIPGWVSLIVITVVGALLLGLVLLIRRRQT